MTIKKCKCGCDTFIITETLTHKANIDLETGILEAYKNFSNEIEDVTCNDCGANYTIDEFKDISFNY